MRRSRIVRRQQPDGLNATVWLSVAVEIDLRFISSEHLPVLLWFSSPICRLLSVWTLVRDCRR